MPARRQFMNVMREIWSLTLGAREPSCSELGHQDGYNCRTRPSYSASMHAGHCTQAEFPGSRKGHRMDARSGAYALMLLLVTPAQSGAADHRFTIKGIGTLTGRPGDGDRELQLAFRRNGVAFSLRLHGAK